MDPGSGQGLPFGAGIHATTTGGPPRTAIFGARTEHGIGGGREATTEKGNKKGPGSPQPVPKEPTSRPKERWVTVPGDKPEATELVHMETAKTSGSSSQKTGHTLHHLPGRPANNAADTESPGEDCTGHSHAAPSSGLPNQLGEGCSCPNTGDPVPGSQSGLNPDDSSPAGGQAEGYCSGMQSGLQEGQDHDS